MADRGWVVASRCVGALETAGGRCVFRHVLGRHRVVGKRSLADMLERYRLPRVPSPDEVASEPYSVLWQAGLLRPAGGSEIDWIRLTRERAEAMRRESASSLPLSLPLPASDSSGPPPAPTLSLHLSPALAVARLDARTVLATHPLGSPVLMSDDLWELALSFEQANSPVPAFAHAAEFLRRQAILWPQGEEKAAAEQFMVSAPDGLSRPAGDRFRQIWQDYDLASVNRPLEQRHVAMVGPCLAQQHAECFEHLALTRGYAVDIQSILTAEVALAARNWSLIFLHPGKYLPSLVHAAIDGDEERCREVGRLAAAAIASDIDRVRAQSRAPVAIPRLLVPPLLPAASDRSGQTLREEVAAINRHVLEMAEVDGSIVLLDEERERDFLALPSYLDCYYTASSHCAPVASWTYPLFKPELLATDAAQTDSDLVPPLPEGQADPALALARALLREIERQDLEIPVQAIFVEPNDILWRGLLTQDSIESILQRMLLADVEDYLFAGLHEALVALSASGVAVHLISRSDRTAVDGLLERMDPHRHLLTRGRLASISGDHSSEIDKHMTIRRLLEAAGLEEQSALWIDFIDEAPDDFEGRFASAGMRWSLREYLLSAPELHPLPARRNDACRRKPADAPSKRTAAQDIQRIVDEALAAKLGLAPGEIAASTHLSELGLDSLGVLQLLAELEKRLCVTLPSWERLEPASFDRAGLAAALEAYLSAHTDAAT